MQNFRVTVNGKTFEVSVEEIKEQAIQDAQPVEKPAAKPAPASASNSAAPVSAAAATGAVSVEAGDIPVTAPLAGTILSFKVKPGEQVKKGQILLTLEALKMENEIVASEAGVVKDIFVQTGAMVNVGDILLTLRSL